MTHKVFICYRRANKELARSIQDRLTAEFGPGSVFMDIDSIGGGRDWEEKVTQVLNDEPVVVTLVTTVWNSRRAGKPKLLDEDDHVRFELQSALKKNLAVVPVLYDRANWPKEEHLPAELRSILRFQNVHMSQQRWDYDINELIKALRDVMGLSAAGTSRPTPERQTRSPQDGLQQFPQLYTRSMFQETPEKRKQREKDWEEIRKRNEERRLEAREREPKFYQNWLFWVASTLTIGLGSGAWIGAEFLASGAMRITIEYARWFADASIPAPSAGAALVLFLMWALARIWLSAVTYSYDPDEGAAAFFGRGIFGGYLLLLDDDEPVGIFAAWPIATIVGWFLARVGAWVPYALMDWNYTLVFWLILGLYTLPVCFFYVLFTCDEATDLTS